MKKTSRIFRSPPATCEPQVERAPEDDARAIRDIREFTKPRRQRQRERHQTKELISRTIAVHVRYNSLYISLPSSTKQQREMTKFCVA